MGTSAVDVSVVLCTYNRRQSLSIALDALCRQNATVRFEIIVVDNNSDDGTGELAESYRARFPNLVRCIFEPRQGLPYARNAGIRAARAPIVAFTDDDVYVANAWVDSIKHAFDGHPEVDLIGGKVIPRWDGVPPTWFSRKLMSPLALQDKGDVPMEVSASNAAPCLIGANFAFRRSLFDRIGMFDGTYTVTEDREIQIRMWRAGCQGLYMPEIVTWVDVPAERLTKTYFRMWYKRSAGYHSRMALLDQIDREGALDVDLMTRTPRLFGSPSYLYREALEHAVGWAKASAQRDEKEAFHHECRMRFVVAYIAARYRRHVAENGSHPIHELTRFFEQRKRGKQTPQSAVSSPIETPVPDPTDLPTSTHAGT